MTEASVTQGGLVIATAQVGLNDTKGKGALMTQGASMTQ